MKNSAFDILSQHGEDVQALLSEINEIDIDNPTLLEALDELASILSTDNVRKLNSNLG